MNKIFLYTASQIITSVDFLFFDSSGELQQTVTGSKNDDSVWECTVPALSAGRYNVVGISGTKTLGKEEIQWDGTNITSPEVVVAKAVRTELSSELVHLVSLQNGLTSNQATMLLELYRIMGLDPAHPLVVTRSSRTAGDISQTIVDDDGTSTTVTRI
jgi:hypothetical protein